MAGIIVFIILFLTPFVVFPFITHQFEPPKVILVEILIGILIFVTILKHGIKFFSNINKSLLILTGGIFLLSIYHLIFNLTPVTIFGNEFRLQGSILLWFLIIFSLTVSKIGLPKIGWQFYTAILTMLFALSFLIGNPLGRAVATIGEPNALAGYVVFLWPFIFFSKFKSAKTKKYTLIFATIVSISIILLANSASGLIALFIQLIFVLAIYKLNFSLKKAIVFCLILLLFAYTLPFLEHNRYENRVDIWQTAIKTSLASPIVGIGFGNTEIAIRKTSLNLKDQLVGYYIDSGHNIFIDWLIQGGLVGFSLLVSIIYLVFHNLYVHKKISEITILIGVLSVLSFNPASVVSLVGFWWVLGVSFKSSSLI